MSSGISWYYDSLTPGLFEFPSRMMGAIFATLTYEADNLQGHMQDHAPWTDRTGNARQGLAAEAYAFGRSAGTRNAAGQFQKAGTTMGIVLYHQVPYGIFLEKSNGKRFAIIMPTIHSEGPEVMRTVSQVLDAMR